MAVGDLTNTKICPTISNSKLKPDVIKRIELVNFMSHRHTVIEPAEGLTVLVGPNNCGKSAFVTALQIVCHNSASGFVLRHGEKKCEIIVETRDGHVIQWSRKKNGAGIYVVDGKQYDRLRGKVPEAVHKILKMPKVLCDKDEFDIHFGEQSDPVFLLKDRGKAAAQFFASSSDATHLVTMQHEHKSNVTVAKRDFKRLSKQQEYIQVQLDKLEPLEGIDQRVAAVETQYVEILEAKNRTDTLQSLTADLRSSEVKLQNSIGLSTALTDLKKPPQLSDDQAFEFLINRIVETTSLQAANAKRCLAMQLLTSPPQIENTDGLERLVGKFRDTEVQLGIGERFTTQLESIEPPPVLAADQALENLLDQIRLKSEAHRSAKTMADVLADVEAPQPQTPVQPLQDLIQQLNRCDDLVTRAQAKLNVTQSAKEPPSLIDSSAIEQLICEIAEKANVLKQRNADLTNTMQRLQSVRSDIDDWVKSNPACPTCGSQTSKSKLAEHACQYETPAEGSDHG